MGDLDNLIGDLVVANRILANEGVLDAYGHVSVRHPADPKRYLISRSRSPQWVDAEDILEYSLEGDALSRRRETPYTERHIHGAIYEARPDVLAVVHSHADEVLPFSVSSAPLRPVIHTASGMGARLPVWDIADRFGPTDLLVSNMQHGRDLAKCLAVGRVVLMRGHGFSAAGRTLKEVVKTAVYVPKNARVLSEALRLGDVKYLSQEEIDLRLAADSKPARFDRAWEYWSLRAGVRVKSRKRR